jgi:aldose 1-epimerase
VIRLEAGDWRAELEPRLGGAVLSLTFRGRPILRPTPEGADDPLQTACFPLVPYANRIRRGRFRFDGQAHDIGATPGFEPHALHGVGWRTAWTAEQVDAHAAVLTLRHDAGADWPWAFDAEQRLVLSDDGLSIVLSLTNRDDRAAPAGVGLHPYFHRPPDARLTLAAPRVWLTDDLIPRALAPADALFDWSGGPSVADAPFVDNAYDGWTGEALLASSNGGAVIAAPGVDRVHVYAPQGADFVCIEPVTHRPDALNAPDGEPSGLVVLQPGQSLSLSMRIGAPPEPRA